MDTQLGIDGPVSEAAALQAMQITDRPGKGQLVEGKMLGKMVFGGQGGAQT